MSWNDTWVNEWQSSHFSAGWTIPPTFGREAKQERLETCVCADLWFPCLFLLYNSISGLSLALGICWNSSSVIAVWKMWVWKSFPHFSTGITVDWENSSVKVRRSFFKLSSEFDCLLIMCNTISAECDPPSRSLSFLSSRDHTGIKPHQSSRVNVQTHTQSVKWAATEPVWLYERQTHTPTWNSTCTHTIVDRATDASRCHTPSRHTHAMLTLSTGAPSTQNQSAPLVTQYIFMSP